MYYSVHDGIILREDNNGTHMCKKIPDILEVWMENHGDHHNWYVSRLNSD